MSDMVPMTSCMMHGVFKSRLYEYMFERKRSFFPEFFFLNKQVSFMDLMFQCPKICT